MGGWITRLYEILKIWLWKGYGPALYRDRKQQDGAKKAIKLVREYEGKIPRKYIPDFLKFIDCNEEEFLRLWIGLLIKDFSYRQQG